MMFGHITLLSILWPYTTGVWQ